MFKIYTNGNDKFTNNFVNNEN